MMTKTAQKLWTAYPGWHLHCEVTAAGVNAYQIVVSLHDQNNQVVASIEHFGSGNLAQLKDEALNRLYEELNEIVA